MSKETKLEDDPRYQEVIKNLPQTYTLCGVQLFLKVDGKRVQYFPEGLSSRYYTTANLSGYIYEGPGSSLDLSDFSAFVVYDSRPFDEYKSKSFEEAIAKLEAIVLAYDKGLKDIAKWRAAQNS